MSEQYFDYPPSVPVLQELVRPSLLIDGVTTVAKAVRMWKILRSLYARGTDFNRTEFSYNQWRDFFFKNADQFHNKRDKLPEHQDPECLCHKTIRNLIEEDNPENWDNWKQKFKEIYQIIAQIKDIDLEKYLKDIESQYPFWLIGKSMQNTFQNDLNGWLSFKGKQKYIKNQEIPQLNPILYSEQIISKSESDTYESNLELNFLLEDYSLIAEQFSKPINGIQRLFFHPDYKIPPGETTKTVYSNLKKLKSVWQEKPVPIIKIQYKSSRLLGKINDYIIYPVCIYYYQRSFYLCGFGQYPQQDIDKSNWYNYRLDSIQSIQKLDSKTDNIPQDIITASLKEQSEQEQQKIQEDETYNGFLIDQIEHELDAAYGFDFYLDIEEMILRFPHQFEKNYISNTVRHQTFKKIDYRKALKKLDEAQLTQKQREQLKEQIKNHPDDGYYTLNYRKNENSVIMRLRAWSPNVEVIVPWDLRQRMKEDIKQTWELYQED